MNIATARAVLDAVRDGSDIPDHYVDEALLVTGDRAPIGAAPAHLPRRRTWELNRTDPAPLRWMGALQ